MTLVFFSDWRHLGGFLFELWKLSGTERSPLTWASGRRFHRKNSLPLIDQKKVPPDGYLAFHYCILVRSTGSRQVQNIALFKRIQLDPTKNDGTERELVLWKDLSHLVMGFKKACVQFWMVYRCIIVFGFPFYPSRLKREKPLCTHPSLRSTAAGHLRFYAQPVHTTVNATSTPDPQKLIFPWFLAIVDFSLKTPPHPPKKKNFGEPKIGQEKMCKWSLLHIFFESFALWTFGFSWQGTWLPAVLCR